MELTWWAVTIAGLVCLIALIALTASLPMTPIRKQMRPLAHTVRLTALPEYRRVVRMQRWTMLVIVTLLIVAFLAALLAGSRPIGPASANRSGETASPEDIMLCVGAPVTDPTSAGFLNYFARQAQSFTTQRIGLTSATLRVVPLTLDHRFVADRFSQLAKLAATQQSLDADRPVSAADLTSLRTGIADFSRPLNYVDYAPSVEDILALCMAGFPADIAARHPRRSLIYLGDSTIRRIDEPRPSLFSTEQVKAMAAGAGIQVNAIVRSGRPDPALRGVNDLHSIATGTGGKFEIYNPIGTAADIAGGTGPTLTATLDRIRAAPPPPADTQAGEVPISTRYGEKPTVPLIAALITTTLLSLVLLRARL